MKKICFIADAASPHTKKWVEGCKSLNAKIFVISHRSGDIPGATVIVHPLSLTGFFRYALAVRRLIRSLQPDLIHAHQFGAHALYALFAGCAPVVITAWGSDILVNSKKSIFLRGLIRWEIKRAALITAVNSYLAKAIIQLGADPKKVITVPIGIKKESFLRLSRATKDNEHFIICSPRLHEPIYNLGEILKAFAAIAEDYPAADLWVLGQGSQTDHLKSYVRDNKLEDRVRFYGMVSPEKVNECLAQSQIVISIPSSDALPVSVLAGMAAGCLPILSDLPTFNGWVIHGINGLVVEDLKELPAVLRQSIEDQVLREQAAVINRQMVGKRAIMEDQFQIMLEKYRYLLTIGMSTVILFLVNLYQSGFLSLLDELA